MWLLALAILIPGTILTIGVLVIRGLARKEG
jgi:hypothetical protein